MKTRDELLQLGCGTEIADDAIEHGYTPVFAGENGKSGDDRVSLWQCNGEMAAATNGRTVWQSSDPEGYRDLLSDG